MAVAPQPPVVENDRLLVRPDRLPPVAVTLDRREDVPGERVHAAVRGVQLICNHRAERVFNGPPGRAGCRATSSRRGRRSSARWPTCSETTCSPRWTGPWRRQRSATPTRSGSTARSATTSGSSTPGWPPTPSCLDAVFPGCQCYRMHVGGVARYVFVVDRPDWNGKCRQQSAARWIVPHFIFRDEERVLLAKGRYEELYNLYAQQHRAPPDKRDFDSVDIHRFTPGGAAVAAGADYAVPLPPRAPIQAAIAKGGNHLYQAGRPRQPLRSRDRQSRRGAGDPGPAVPAALQHARAPPLPGGVAMPVTVRPWPYSQPEAQRAASRSSPSP